MDFRECWFLLLNFVLCLFSWTRTPKEEFLDYTTLGSCYCVCPWKYVSLSLMVVHLLENIIWENTGQFYREKAIFCNFNIIQLPIILLYFFVIVIYWERIGKPTSLFESWRCTVKIFPTLLWPRIFHCISPHVLT